MKIFENSENSIFWIATGACVFASCMLLAKISERINPGFTSRTWNGTKKTLTGVFPHIDEIPTGVTIEPVSGNGAPQAHNASLPSWENPSTGTGLQGVPENNGILGGVIVEGNTAYINSNYNVMIIDISINNPQEEAATIPEDGSISSSEENLQARKLCVSSTGSAYCRSH